MVSKNNTSKNKIRNIEKYALILLISGYILGMCIGAFFVCSNNINAEFTQIIIINNKWYTLIFFLFALVLKYSGILSGAICTLPVFLGIYNSAYYCNYILNKENKLLYTTILTMLKDTSVCMLLILYIIIIIVQISSKKYILKKDLKYLAVYISGTAIINIIEYILTNIIF